MKTDNFIVTIHFRDPDGQRLVGIVQHVDTGRRSTFFQAAQMIRLLAGEILEPLAGEPHGRRSTD